MPVHQRDNSFQERRSNLRYPVQTEIEYRLVRGQRLMEAGHGEVINISNGGVLFRSAKPLPAGTKIELSLLWPARLSNGSILRVGVRGRVLRGTKNGTAVRILSYDFGLRRNCLGWTPAIEYHHRN
ncbi:MAG TPA: PilZ domain-containing protein [Bryobacteraceae bacterium]|nr:PilZ domain-containing protein [Bryobacteraceae bacterium]